MFKFYQQYDSMDCGPTCLRMVSRFYNKHIPIEQVRDWCKIERDGTSLLGLSLGAEKAGFYSIPAKLNIKKLEEVDLPCILHWEGKHFVVVYKIRRNRYYVADPALGKVVFDANSFLKKWEIEPDSQIGIGIVLKLTPDFYKETQFNGEKTWDRIISYILGYKKLLFQLLIGLAIGTSIQIIAPFLSQAIVDRGINGRNIGFVNLILLGQIILVIGKTSVEFIRAWILLHITTRISISLLTDFVSKIMRLPLKFFDGKQTGDIVQRINDQLRIENFLTSTALTAIFTAFNLIVFSIILFYFQSSIFCIFSIALVLNVIWMALFLKPRRLQDKQLFKVSSESHNEIVQLMNGMQEIKLNNYETKKKWAWEALQARVFRLKSKILSLNQYQSGGNTFINESKNAIITFLSARAVITGQLTLGEMVAIQFIVGQMNAPLEAFVTFIHSFQDAKISLERLNEIYRLTEETDNAVDYETELPKDKSIYLDNVSFKYDGYSNPLILNDINLVVPAGKTTAIVGASGSGKTTLLKLLLKFYEPTSGNIKIGGIDLKRIDNKVWRKNCGTVMQDGFIFSDTISQNISISDLNANAGKVNEALTRANINTFVDELPLGAKTLIGASGNGLSQGQKQRLLIARAIYKDPEYVFLDEATNALDSITEKAIMSSLETFLEGKTVVVVAHRLSTVKNADNIIVLDHGMIMENGSHNDLINLKGYYYRLVKNQLELGA